MTLLSLVIAFWSFSALPAFAVHADEAPPAATQLEMNIESCSGLEKADKELNVLYKKILNDRDYGKDKAFIPALRESQRAWLRFRDAALEARYPGKDKQVEWGSRYRTCSCNLLTELTKARANELKLWADGVPEGDVCGGSAKVKGSR